MLNVIMLRRRGFTSRCAELLEPLVPLAEPLPDPLVPGVWYQEDEAFCPPLELPIFVKLARMADGGKPVNAECGYSPRSATLMADGNRSLPTMWIDQSFIPCPGEGRQFSAMPPFFAALFCFVSRMPFPLLETVLELLLVPFPPAIESDSAIAIE